MSLIVNSFLNMTIFIINIYIWIIIIAALLKLCKP